MATPYIPTEFQAQVHFDEHRFRVAVFHRQAGKSTMAVNEVIRHAKENPGRYWIILPTYRQAKTVTWPLLLAFTPEDWILKANESSLEVRLKNGAEIALKGAENKEALLGATLKGVVMDEYGSVQRNVWSEIIQPMLLRHGGWALFIGTPRGKNHFYEVYQFGLSDTHADQWKSYHLSVWDSGVFPTEEIERIRKTIPQNIFEAEYEAKFLEGSGQVFRRIKENATTDEQAPQRDRLYQVGVDLARLENFTVISVIDRHTHEQVYIDRFNQLDWQTQRARIEAVARRYNDARIVIDQTGIGDPVVEELQRLNLAVDGFKYSGEKKKLLVENLVKMLEQDRLHIFKSNLPLGDVQMRELEAFMYTKNEDSGKYRYHAPEGLHDDVVNALALSVWEIGEKLPLPEDKRDQPDTYFVNPYE